MYNVYLPASVSGQNHLELDRTCIFCKHGNGYSIKMNMEVKSIFSNFLKTNISLLESCLNSNHIRSLIIFISYLYQLFFIYMINDPDPKYPKTFPNPHSF